MTKNIFYILFFILIFPKISNSQIPYETSKAALIFQFAKKITNAQCDKNPVYRIAFLGDDIKTLEELQKIAKSNLVNGKKTEIFQISSLNNISDLSLIYIDKNWSKKIEEVWVNIKGKNILLVSEQCSDAKYIMLNILFNPPEKKVSFEINKANLIIENFEINPEVTLLGGKEVDIRELYIEIKAELENEKAEVEIQKTIIDEKISEINNLKHNADSLKFEINKQLNEIFKSEIKLINLADNIKIQQLNYNIKLNQIKIQEEKLLFQEQELNSKRKEVEETTVQLRNLISESNKNKNIILQQTNILSDKENIIKTKNRQLFLSIGFVFLLIILVFLAFYAFKLKQNANKKIEAQKSKLEKTVSELEKAQKQLVQSEKMASLGVLTAGIAHEINNPINYINSGIEGLKTIISEMKKVISKYQEFNKNPETRNHAEIEKKINEEFDFLISGTDKMTKNIQSGVNKAGEIVKSLSIFSRNDKAELTLSDLHENIDSSITLLQNQIKKRIKIIKNYNEIPKIYCYPAKLNQVFLNLISNAIHAIENEGNIEITTSYISNSEIDNSKKDCILISIKDDGIGIPKNIIEHIFEPFFTTKEQGIGTGLGLSISYEIIEQHKGKILAKNNDIKGTEFSIIIPAIVNNE